MLKIAPSILCADFRRLGEEVAALTEAGADWLHFDCMDGHFVDNLTFGPVLLQALRPLSPLPFDAHLMVTNPAAQVELYAEAGADHIMFHAEVETRPVGLLSRIRALGKKAGLVYNPATPLECMEAILPAADCVLIMSVEPGAAGQPFMPIALRKIAALRELIDREGLSTQIAVDGGVNRETGPEVVAAGADVVITGSWLFRHEGGYRGAMEELRGMAAGA